MSNSTDRRKEILAQRHMDSPGMFLFRAEGLHMKAGKWINKTNKENELEQF